MKLGTGIGVVVEVRGIKAVELDRFDAGRAGRIQPFIAGEQRHSIAGGEKT